LTHWLAGKIDADHGALKDCRSTIQNSDRRRDEAHTLLAREDNATLQHRDASLFDVFVLNMSSEPEDRPSVKSFLPGSGFLFSPHGIVRCLFANPEIQRQ
jgi:hypothetical protein